MDLMKAMSHLSMARPSMGTKAMPAPRPTAMAARGYLKKKGRGI